MNFKSDYMKKILMIAVLAVLVTGTAAAQAINVNKEAILKKLAKSDEDLNNEKRNTKSAYWLERGKAYTEAGAAPSEGMYAGIDMTSLQLMFGKHLEEGQATMNGVPYATLTYPNFVAYTSTGSTIDFWVPTLVIIDNAFDTAEAAYRKAYEVDPKSASKVKSGLQEIANEYKKSADWNYRQGKLDETAKVFSKAYEIQAAAPVNVIDTSALYNAGMFYVYANEFAKAEPYLTKALEYKYESDGDIYYYLFHSYYGRDDFAKAEEVLKKGLELYPNNSNIVESLVSFYTTGESDPKEAVPMIEGFIAKDPNNPALWNGLGGVYYKLEDYSKAFESFEKALEIDPNDPFNYFRVGSVYIDLGNEMVRKLGETSYTSNAEYQKALDETNDVYKKAIPVLEKGLEMDPSNKDAVMLLKNVTFRLRDEEGMQAKYDHYSALLDSM